LNGLVADTCNVIGDIALQNFHGVEVTFHGHYTQGQWKWHDSKENTRRPINVT